MKDKPNSVSNKFHSSRELKINSPIKKQLLKDSLYKQLTKHQSHFKDILVNKKKILKDNKLIYNSKLKEYNTAISLISSEEDHVVKLQSEIEEIVMSNELFISSIDSKFFSNYLTALSDPSIDKEVLNELFTFFNIENKPYFLLKKMIKSETELKFLFNYGMQIAKKNILSLPTGQNSTFQCSLINTLNNDFKKIQTLDTLYKLTVYPLNDILKFIKNQHKILELEREIGLIENNIQTVLYKDKNNYFLQLKNQEHEITNTEHDYNEYKDLVRNFDNIINDLTLLDNNIEYEITERIRRFIQIFSRYLDKEEKELIDVTKLNIASPISSVSKGKSKNKTKSDRALITTLDIYNKSFNKSKELITKPISNTQTIQTLPSELNFDLDPFVNRIDRVKKRNTTFQLNEFSITQQESVTNIMKQINSVSSNVNNDIKLNSNSKGSLIPNNATVVVNNNETLGNATIEELSEMTEKRIHSSTPGKLSLHNYTKAANSLYHQAIQIKNENIENSENKQSNPSLINKVIFPLKPTTINNFNIHDAVCDEMLDYTPLNKIPSKIINRMPKSRKPQTTVAAKGLGIQMDTKEFGNPTECCAPCT